MVNYSYGGKVCGGELQV